MFQTRTLPRCARKAALALFLAAASLGASAADAQAEWPGKVITYVVPYPAGGTTDILARLLAQKLGQSLHTTVIVENRPGATGAIARPLWRGPRRTAIPC